MKLRSPRARRARALWLSRKRMLELKVDEDRYKMIDLQKHVAQVAVDVAAEGLVLPVVAFFAASAKELDKTIVRAFVARLADVAGPPFSDAFAGGVSQERSSSVKTVAGDSAIRSANLKRQRVVPLCPKPVPSTLISVWPAAGPRNGAREATATGASKL